MAEINVGVNKTNDPSYLGNSQGTDRASLQPLASVPELSTKYVQPDHQVNRTTGTAIKGLGDLAESALKLTDAVIQRKADDVLTKGIQDIRDSFGVGAASQDSGVAKAVGQGGAEGVSLTDADKGNQPVAINRLGNRIAGLTEQYQQGGLSNSAYYAKLESFVRETKAQFPGYSSEIDSMVATKVGTTPANALRSALLNDVTSLQNKVQSLNDKWTTFEHQKASEIYSIWPNYDQIKHTLSRSQVEAEVGRREARASQMDTRLKELAVIDKNDANRANTANDVALQIGSEISRNTIIGITNTMGIQSAGDLRQYIIDVQTGKRPQPSPDELNQLSGLFSTLEQKATAKFNEKANKPLNGNTTETLASVLRDPSKLDAARNVALSDIRTIKEGLFNEQHGLVAATVQWNKANDAITDKNLATAVPNLNIAASVRRKIGDNAISNLIIDSQSGMGADLMVGLRNAGWAAASQGTPIIETATTMSKDDRSGAAVRQHVKDTTSFVINQDKLADKSLGDSSFKSLYGPGNRMLIDAYNSSPGAQVQAFKDMVRPEMTAAVKKRNAADQKMYTEWANDSFTSVFQTQANGVNAAANSYKINGNLSLEYDPENQQFSYKGSRASPQGIVNNANQKLQPLNAAIGTMKDVWKMSGQDPNKQLHDRLLVMGIEPGSPLYKALDDQIRKMQTEEQK